MPSPIKYNHNPGDQLQASTVSYLLRNTGISGDNIVSGGGQNSILPPPTDAQNMADLTHSTIGQVYSHSVIYCVPTSNGYSFCQKRPVFGV